MVIMFVVFDCDELEKSLSHGSLMCNVNHYNLPAQALSARLT